MLVDRKMGDAAAESWEGEELQSPSREDVVDTIIPWKKRIKIALMWQGVSVLLTGTAVFSQLLADEGVNLPTTQSFLNYLVLGLLFGSKMYLRGESPREPWWKYCVIAFCDVQGNFLLVLAYQYTSIISVQLLDCFTIPVVMILSCKLLGARYRRMHLVGACTALVGLCMLVTADSIEGRTTSTTPARSPLLGDMLVITGASLYGVSNIGQEFMVKERDRIEFLAHLGAFGAIISGIQMGALESRQIRSLILNGSLTIFIYFIGFNLCLLGMYLSVPVILETSSAAFMNLSLLTADFYSLVVALLLFSAKPSVLYFAAFGIIVSGLAIYNVTGDATSTSTSNNRPYVLRTPSEEEMSEAIIATRTSQHRSYKEVEEMNESIA
ncbi:hypothetical protein AAMO2058_000663800 [Amorphochlora amoebiformis]